jgi:hypothetical protein
MRQILQIIAVGLLVLAPLGCSKGKGGGGGPGGPAAATNAPIVGAGTIAVDPNPVAPLPPATTGKSSQGKKTSPAALAPAAPALTDTSTLVVSVGQLAIQPGLIDASNPVTAVELQEVIVVKGKVIYPTLFIAASPQMDNAPA